MHEWVIICPTRRHNVVNEKVHHFYSQIPHQATFFLNLNNFVNNFNTDNGNRPFFNPKTIKSSSLNL